MITPTISDVIGGRGGNVNCHPGNMVLLKRVKTLQPIYKSFENGQDGKKKKSNMTQEVVEWALGRGRFLKPSSEDATLWQEATSQEAYNKVSHLLRDDHSREGMLKKRKKYATSKKAGGFKAAPQPVRAKDRDEARNEDGSEALGFVLGPNLVNNHEHIEALRAYDANQHLFGNNHGQKIADHAAVANFQAPQLLQVDPTGNEMNQRLLPIQAGPVVENQEPLPRQGDLNSTRILDPPDLDRQPFFSQFAQEVDNDDELIEALGPFDADQQLQQGQQLAHNNAGLDDVFQEWFFSQYAQEVDNDHELIEALEPFDADQQLADNNAGLDDLFQEWLDKA